jgi:hypothetical protein
MDRFLASHLAGTLGSPELLVFAGLGRFRSVIPVQKIA